MSPSVCKYQSRNAGRAQSRNERSFGALLFRNHIIGLEPCRVWQAPSGRWRRNLIGMARRRQESFAKRSSRHAAIVITA